MEKISIRNATFAKIGLQDMIDYIGGHINISKVIMAEIGSYVGDSTEIFARSVQKIYAIDPWKNGYDENDNASHQHRMEIIEKQFDKCIVNVYGNVTKIKGKSLESVLIFDDDYFDVVYIDGMHTYGEVKRDIQAWLPKIRKGGFICGHDYQGKFPGTIQAVDEFKQPDKIFRDTSWCVRV